MKIPARLQTETDGSASLGVPNPTFKMGATVLGATIGTSAAQQMPHRQRSPLNHAKTVKAAAVGGRVTGRDLEKEIVDTTIVATIEETSVVRVLLQDHIIVTSGQIITTIEVVGLHTTEMALVVEVNIRTLVG